MDRCCPPVHHLWVGHWERSILHVIEPSTLHSSTGHGDNSMPTADILRQLCQLQLRPELPRRHLGRPGAVPAAAAAAAYEVKQNRNHSRSDTEGNRSQVAPSQQPQPTVPQTFCQTKNTMISLSRVMEDPGGLQAIVQRSLLGA